MKIQLNCRTINSPGFSEPGQELKIYYGNSINFIQTIPMLANYLSDHEKQRANRFKNRSDHYCYIAVHALLRIELSKLLKIEPELLPIINILNGKPCLESKEIPFSLSRSKSKFVFAIGKQNQSLGIDLEEICTDLDLSSIYMTIFGKKEQRAIIKLENQHEKYSFFYTNWTRREALLKALGIGINTDLKKIQVFDGESIIKIDGLKQAHRRFYLTTLLNSMTIMSIASSTDCNPGIYELTGLLE